jgi:hypothetical protein
MTAESRKSDLVVPLLALAIGVGFLIWAHTYSARDALVPILVGWVAIVLTLIDIATQFDTAPGRFLSRIVAAEQVIAWRAEGDEAAPWSRVLLSMAWVLAYVAAIYVVGFLWVTPVYVFVYMLFHGRKSLLASLAGAVLITLIIWLTFEKAFRYPLYPGILFGGY